MKRILWISLLASLTLLNMTGCISGATETPIPPISLNVSDTSESNFVKASAIAVPAQQTRLSFVIPGMVKDLTVQEGDRVSAGQELVFLDTSEMEYNLVVAQAALKTAEVNAQLQRQPSKKFDTSTFKFTTVGHPGELIEIADAKVDQSQFALDAVKASIAQTTLMAPFDATVIFVDVLPGEYVNPGQVVLELAKLDELKIETTDLGELNIASVKVGQAATVYIEALGENFPGTVTAISPISNTVGGDVVFKVTIQLDEQPDALRWGMSADVEINVE